MTGRLVSLGLLSLLLAPSTLFGVETAVATVEQTLCPVMAGNPIDRGIYTDYEGKRVYLCCMMCLSEFKANPKPYLSKLPQFAASLADQAADAEPLEGGQDDGPYEDAVTDQTPHGVAKLIEFAGKFHPVAVHIPIALIIAAALSEMLACATGKQRFREIARFNVIIAALGAMVAVALGLASGAFANYPPALARTLSIHKYLGIAAGILIIASAALCEASCRNENNALRLGYRIALVISVVLVSLSGLYGGYLVYGTGHYAW